MELKWEKDLSEERLSDLADDALDQIDEKRYDTEMSFLYNSNIENSKKEG